MHLLKENINKNKKVTFIIMFILKFTNRKNIYFFILFNIIIFPI
jgi:hypothetical protein